MAVTEAPKELFKSNRLLYRAVENSEAEKTFFSKHIQNDFTIQTLSTRRLRRPAHRESALEQIQSLRSSLLGVVICLLPQKTPEEVTSSSETTPSGQSSQISEPIPIGFLALHADTPETTHHRNAMIALSLADGYRGQGYGGEAINWILDWGFQQAGLHRISIGAFDFNHNALKLYRKLGFVDEGREREAVYHFRAWRDIINLSMLEQEWEVLRGISSKELLGY